MSSYLDKYSDEICTQRKEDGDPCRSRALRGEKVCHYHKVMGTPKINIDNGPARLRRCRLHPVGYLRRLRNDASSPNRAERSFSPSLCHAGRLYQHGSHEWRESST